MCEDDEVFLAATPSERTRRVWPYPCALAFVAVAGVGGHAMWSRARSNVDAVTSLHSHHSWPWYPAWRDRPHRLDEHGCSWDGDDCSSSRCCASEGSRCYVKSSHWASCNETCHQHRKWEAGQDNRGHWVATHHPVWACNDITVPRAAPATAAPTTPATQAPAPQTPAPAAASQYSIFTSSKDSENREYGDRAPLKSSAAAPSTSAPVTWADGP